VARRHRLTPQRLFTWRRLARVEGVPDTPPLFVPAVVKVPRPDPSPPTGSPRRARRRSKADGIELEIGGVAVRVSRDAGPRAIEAVIRALKAGS
jgi:transposase